jgi:hypothetical protein
MIRIISEKAVFSRLIFSAIAWLALMGATKPAEAFILTFGDVSKMLQACPAVKDETANVLQGEIFAFLKSSISSGSANLLTLKSTFILSERYLPGSSEEYSAYSNCATQQAVKFLEGSGVRIIHTIAERDPEVLNKNLAFMPSLFGDSISAYEPVKVARDVKTTIEFGSISCDAKLSSPYVVYPLDPKSRSTVTPRR